MRNCKLCLKGGAVQRRFQKWIVRRKPDFSLGAGYMPYHCGKYERNERHRHGFGCYVCTDGQQPSDLPFEKFYSG